MHAINNTRKNTLNTRIKQRGFFDLGLGLVLLSVFSATAYTIDSAKKDNSEQATISVSQNQNTAATVNINRED